MTHIIFFHAGISGPDLKYTIEPPIYLRITRKLTI